MSAITSVAVIAGLLGAAAIGGVFFAFSSFVMGALRRLSPDAGIEAMQSINVVVINRSFLGAFMGTAVLCLGLVVLAIDGWDTEWAPFVLGGAVCYFAGTFLVTVMGNVPLNNQLAELVAGEQGAAALWTDYIDRWTRLNSLRAVAAMSSTLMLALALIRSGG